VTEAHALDPLTITDVVVPIDDGVAPFELGVACELFGLDRSDQGLPTYRFALAGVHDRPVRTTAGFSVTADAGLERMDSADLVVLVAGSWTEREPHPALTAGLHAAHERGAHVMAICRGAFVLAATGLLDGHRATTHWRWTDEFQLRFPRIQVDPEVLYVDNGNLSTSAGTAAGIDLGLHLLRRAHGTRTANEVARRMVVAPHRAGGQAQFIQRPVPRASHQPPVQDVLDWARSRLDETLTVDDLAARARMTPRTFARHFVDDVGTTPHQWLTTQRIELGRELLETTALTVGAIAHRCGYGSPDAFRAAFTANTGATPGTYRTTFAGVTRP
jgi:transcriptional regulator GlxA family with amidase domain